ncbi:unnamed protein product [Closterium sp. Naga37s-1]|nr:unnamed protein product [Closterium sp. Naga37s-1]
MLCVRSVDGGGAGGDDDTRGQYQLDVPPGASAAVIVPLSATQVEEESTSIDEELIEEWIHLVKMTGQWLRYGIEGDPGTALRRRRKGGRRAGAQEGSEKFQVMSQADIVHYVDVSGAWERHECECCYDRAVSYRAQRALGIVDLAQFRSMMRTPLLDSTPLAPQERPCSAIVEYSARVPMAALERVERWCGEGLFGFKCAVAPIRAVEAMILEWMAEPCVGVLMDLARIRSRLPAILPATDVATAAPAPRTAAAPAAAIGSGTWATRWAAYRRAVSFAAFLALVARCPRVVNLIIFGGDAAVYPAIAGELGAGRQVESDCFASMLVQAGWRRRMPRKTGEEGRGGEDAEKAQGEEGQADCEVMNRRGRVVYEEERGGVRLIVMHVDGGGASHVADPTHSSAARRGDERRSSGAAHGGAGEQQRGRGGRNGQWRENLKGREWERYVDGMAWILEHGEGGGREFRCSHCSEEGRQCSEEGRQCSEEGRQCSEEGSSNGGDEQVKGAPKGMYVSGVSATDLALALATALSQSERCADTCMYIMDGNNAAKGKVEEAAIEEARSRLRTKGQQQASTSGAAASTSGAAEASAAAYETRPCARVEWQEWPHGDEAALKLPDDPDARFYQLGIVEESTRGVASEQRVAEEASKCGGKHMRRKVRGGKAPGQGSDSSGGDTNRGFGEEQRAISDAAGTAAAWSPAMSKLPIVRCVMDAEYLVQAAGQVMSAPACAQCIHCWRDFNLCLPSIALIAKFAYRPLYVLFNRFLSVFPPHSDGFDELVKIVGFVPFPPGPPSRINLAILRGEVEKQRVFFLLLVALLWPASILDME